jgi:murein DD-endopeptidase MepM/ murein hydrolase activator NlpD
LLASSSGFGQTFIPNNFRSPVDTTIVLSGNFGELRHNHFHYGLDITSGGKEGLKVFACDDGYLSRIKVSTSGYGKVIYITHANGYTTVYGHLQKFHGKIAQLIKDHQYKNEVFEVELFPGKDFKIKKGDLIGYVGNTGSSTGPHLHFEVRQTSTEKIINPLYFGFPVSDTVPPSLSSLMFYTMMPGGNINGKSDNKEVKLIKKKGKYYAETKDTLVLSGFIGIGIDAYDMESKKNSQNGLYCLHMYVDNVRTYSYCIDSFAFSDSRNVNAHVDYEWFIKKGRFVQRCFLVPCNKMPIYSFMMDNAVIHFDGNRIHQLKFIARDFNGNETVFNYTVKGAIFTGSPFDDTTDLSCTKPFETRSKDFQLKMPEGCVYEDQKFFYSMSKDTLKGTFTPIHTIMNKYISCNNAYEAKFRIPNMPDSLKSKLYVAYVTEGNQLTRVSGGGKVSGEWINITLRDFGRFTVAIDTIPPKLVPVLVKDKPKNPKALEVRVIEKPTVIDSFRGTIDGKWELFEYEPKTRILTFTPDENFPEGKHHVVLEVKDSKGNSGKKEFDFTWKKPAQ